MPPENIGHFRITSKLGEGGMGAVYRATDTKLNRDVAVKILPDSFAQDADRLARFTREAQVLASLNHPNIAAIYGVEDGALILELVDGSTLAERIAQGPIPVDEALPLIRQLIEALEYAHENGVIHRDLKPANIKIASDGRLKVLDFGLAKALSSEAAAANPASSPTLTMRATMAGMILGTAGYMAPEQARGKPADKRADIWSFGVVVLEMLSGRQTFPGETVPDTLAAVLRGDVEWSALPAATPAPLRRILRRCLERDRKKRLRDIGDALFELDEPEPVAAPAPAVQAQSRFLNYWLMAALAVAAAALAVSLFWKRSTPPAEVPMARFILAPPQGQTFGNNGFSLSPDGRHLAFRGAADAHGGTNPQMWIRDLDSVNARQLAGTDNGNYPFWSADSRSLAFVSSGKLKRIPIGGGPVQTICDVGVSFRGGTWNRTDVIVMATGGGLMRVAASGGAPTPALKSGGSDTPRGLAGYPQFLPDGNHFLFLSRGTGVHLASLDGGEKPRRVLQTDNNAVFVQDEAARVAYLLYQQGEALAAARFDTDRLVVSGEPFSVADRVYGAGGKLGFAASAGGGVLVLNEGSNKDDLELAVFDRGGKKLDSLSPIGTPAWGHVDLSPDGSHIAGERSDTHDVWTLDLARKVASRATFNNDKTAAHRSLQTSEGGVPTWSADGSRIFVSSVSGPGIEAVPANGSGTPEMLVKASAHHMHASPDGKWLAYETTMGRSEIDVFSLEKKGQPEPFIKGDAGNPQFSPDSRWLAFSSSETGHSEIYVQSFPAGAGRWQVSSNGGGQVRWRRDGRELVYLSGRQVMAVDVKPKGTALEFGMPKALFELPRLAGTVSFQFFAMSGDGRRFYMNVQDAPTAPTLTVMMNWIATLRK